MSGWKDVRKVLLLTCVELWHGWLLWGLWFRRRVFWSWWWGDIAIDELEDCSKLVIDAVAAGELCTGGERDPCS